MATSVQVLRPAFPYYGGKARLAPKIVALIPPHRVYLEPYAGSAAVLLAKPPCPHEILNDLDGNVVAFYRAMREQPAELRRLLTLTPYSRDEYEAARAKTDDPLERARRFVIRTSMSVNGAGNGGTAGWSMSTARNQSRPGTFAGAVDRLDEIAQRLRRVNIENRSALELIPKWWGDRDAVIYLDPPYLASTRRTTGASSYRLDAADVTHHRQLLGEVKNAKATVIISGYDSPLYRDHLDGWHPIAFDVTKPTGNRAGETATKATEVLWINRAVGPLDEWTAA